MHHAPDPSDYRSSDTDMPPGQRNQGEGMMNETFDAVVERAGGIASDVGRIIKERPLTTLTVAGGLAFVVGALWMLGRRAPQSRLDALLAQLPEMPSRDSVLRRWKS